MITYKGKEIDDSYLINQNKEEVVYSGVDNYQTFTADELLEFYNKALMKEIELNNANIEHSPVQIDICADSGNDYSDDFMEISLTWMVRETEIEHRRRIETKKMKIDKEVKKEEEKAIRAKYKADKEFEKAVDLIEKAGGKVVFFPKG